MVVEAEARPPLEEVLEAWPGGSRRCWTGGEKAD